MQTPRSLAILMIVTIIIIAGFQAFWLKGNYNREQYNLQFKTGVLFRETIMQLQASQLKLTRSSTNGNYRMVFNSAPSPVPGEKVRGEEMVSMVNILQNSIRDSANKKNFVITRVKEPGKQGAIADGIYSFLSGIDSLQDSLKVKQISSKYAAALKSENIPISFVIKKIDSARREFPPMTDEVVVGFKSPVTYKLVRGSSTLYILQKLAVPILLSLFVIAVTMVSFLLMYRNIIQQRKLAAMKNDFIGNITHELKTPIATVAVAIEAMKNFNAMDDRSRTREYLDISANEMQRLSLLVDKVLRLSMFEKKEMELRFDNVNLEELVQEVSTSMQLQLQKHQASVQVQTKGNVWLQGDRLHLTSVIFNLLDNALKYKDGPPQLDIELKEHQDMVMLSVCDNGIGIADEYKEKVFEKFFRVPEGNLHNNRGYGLGLSYAAQVIQKHGGSIYVANNTDKGSCFIITLPKSQ